MTKLKNNEYLGTIGGLIFGGLVLAIVIFYQWPTMGPYGTILMSIELGICVTLLFLFIGSKKRLFFTPSFETTFNRISELTESIQKVSGELISSQQELEQEIEINKNQLESLQHQMDIISKKAEDKKKELDLLESTNPEIVQIFNSITKRNRRWDIIYGFILFVLGVITPYIINYILIQL